MKYVFNVFVDKCYFMSIEKDTTLRDLWYDVLKQLDYMSPYIFDRMEHDRENGIIDAYYSNRSK